VSIPGSKLSRGISNEYTRGAAAGAPDALQVADPGQWRTVENHATP
jgi:hypothetical protein